VRLSVAGETVVTLSPPVLTLSGVEVAVPPGVFLQAVPEAEQQLTKLVLGALKKPKRIADLFSGLGTFTFALARHAPVFACDSDKRAIEALQSAVKRAQGLKPVETRVRDLFREPLSPKELEAFDTVVFDPPRAGASAQAVSGEDSDCGLLQSGDAGAGCPDAGGWRLSFGEHYASRSVCVFFAHRGGGRAAAIVCYFPESRLST
jgi:SAM-dependent methyltransferase